MTKDVKYEWVKETIDEHGDIIDIDHSDVLDFSREDYRSLDIGISRSVGDGINGLEGRLYAYVNKKSGLLPVTFPDSSVKIPVKYHTELKRFLHLNHLAPPATLTLSEAELTRPDAVDAAHNGAQITHDELSTDWLTCENGVFFQNGNDGHKSTLSENWRWPETGWRIVQA